MRRLIIIWTCLLIVGVTLLSAQASSTSELTRADVEELTQDIDYDQQRWTLTPRHKPELNKKADPESTPNLEVGTVGQVLQYILVLGVIILVLLGFVYFFMADRADRDTELRESTGTDIEEGEHIEDIDPLPLLPQAIADGDYRLAMRLRFIELLKTCSERRLIDWRPDKTNVEYLKELNAHMDTTLATALTARYERTWFGQYTIGRDEYEYYAPQFDSLISDLPTR